MWIYRRVEKVDAGLVCRIITKVSIGFVCTRVKNADMGCVCTLVTKVDISLDLHESVKGRHSFGLRANQSSRQRYSKLAPLFGEVICFRVYAVGVFLTPTGRRVLKLVISAEYVMMSEASKANFNNSTCNLT